MTQLPPADRAVETIDSDPAGQTVTGRADGAGSGLKPVRRMPAMARLGLGGLLTLMLGLGLVLGGQGGAAEARTGYLTSKYQHPKYGQTNTAVRNLQLRLADVNVLKDKYVTSYFGDVTRQAVRRFQRSNDLKVSGKVSEVTWKRLVKASGKVKATPRGGSGAGTSSAVIDKRCKTGKRVLCIDKTTRKVYYLNHNKIVKTMDARFGCFNSPTREGIWTIFRKVRHEVSHLYGSKMPYSMYFSGGEAVHYSSDFAARGYAGCSHGCVNIRDKKTLAWVYTRIHVGDRAVVYWS